MFKSVERPHCKTKVMAGIKLVNCIFEICPKCQVVIINNKFKTFINGIKPEFIVEN